MRKTRFLILLLGLFSEVHAQPIAQIWLEETRLEAIQITGGLEVPWSMDSWSEEAILLTERPGKIKRVSLTNGETKVLYEAQNIAVEGQAGLLGLQTHPEFPDTPLVFIATTYYDNSIIRMRIDRLRYSETTDSLSFEQTIVSDLPSGNSNTGGRLFIDSENKLWLTLGDIKDTDLPQDESSLNGKVLRYELDGLNASGNPFANSPVYSIGHRNPQGIVETSLNEMLVSEHGPSSDDELNRLISGGNFGWPLVTGSCVGNEAVCDSINAEEPLFTWSPTIAPAGIDYYDGTLIPEWSNSIITAALKDKRLSIVSLSADHKEATEVTTAFTDKFGRIRDVLVMGERIFLCTSNRDALGTPNEDDDRLIELVPYAHNGLLDREARQLDAFYHDGMVWFNQPVNSQIQVLNILGQILEVVDLQNRTEFRLSDTYHGLVILRDLNSNDTKKLFIP